MQIDKNKNGFTLIEILVSIMILAIGILAVAQLTIMGMQTSRVINRQMYARDLLNRQYEFLQGLPGVDTTYLSHKTSTSLDDTIPGICDYGPYVQTTKGGVFKVIWNVSENNPDPRFKTVRIHVIGQNSKPWMRSDLIKRL